MWSGESKDKKVNQHLLMKLEAARVNHRLICGLLSSFTR